MTPITEAIQNEGVTSLPQSTRSSRPRVGLALVAASCLSMLSVGFTACGKPPSHSPDPAPAEAEAGADEAGVAAEASAGASFEDTEADEVLPAFNDEALAARVQAQRALLGNNLFEDIEGKPVAPSLEVIEGEGNSVEDEILLALPGSGGFGPDGKVAGADSVANGNALGLYVPIEEPREGGALAKFHQALRDLAAGKDEDGKVRILVYGGSHTQADIYPGYFRVYLQTRFGDGGMGFVALNRVNKWFKYQDWYIEETKGWFSEYAQRASARKDGFYGLLGASAMSESKRDRTKLIPRHEQAVAGKYELHYLAQPEGGSFRLYVDGKKHATIKTDERDGSPVSQPLPGYYAFDLPEGSHELEVRVAGDGEVRLYGATLERDQPGVVVDTLGISGTRAANMLKWDQKQWTDQIQRRDPSLFTLFYGTNEATDTNQPIEAYEADLREVIARLQAAAPEASCLLIGPGDFPREVEQDVWVPRPRAIEILAIQRDVAYEMGCGFWDTTAFMGGVGSMHEWATARPQMASRDHIHFTKRGYVRVGMAVIDAMMASFDRQ